MKVTEYFFLIRLKQVDALTLKSLIGPLLVSFMIAIFVLVMQVLYQWIDELADKGVGIFVLLEMIFYLSFIFVPKALLVSILLATVMVFGSLAETYQLASFKAGGISLWRVMRASVAFMVALAVFSFISSNYLIPEAQVKFRKRFHEIKSKKPALVMETGVFNNDFSGYSIRIGSKDRNGQDISDVLLYDMTEGSEHVNVIIAKRGRMQMLEDEGVFVMELFDGQLYQEDRASKRRISEFLTPLVRTEFEALTKVFDLSDFELKESSEDLFKNTRHNKKTSELKSDADTLSKQMQLLLNSTLSKMEYDNALMYNLVDSIEEDQKEKLKRPDLADVHDYVLPLDSSWEESALELFQKSMRSDVIEKTTNSVQTIERESDLSLVRYRSLRKERVKTIYDLHNRYSEAAACLLFLMIGVPMGAIVRKGGFGFPLLIAIVFFVTFMMLSISLRKLSETFVVSPIIAAWFGVLVLAPVGFFLTYIAMNDMKPSWLNDIRAFYGKLSEKIRNNTSDNDEKDMV